MLTTAQTHPTLVKQLRTPLTSHCFSCMLMVTSYALYTTPMHCTQLAQQCYNGYSKACVVIQHV